jgi:DNA-binding MurR/RpiR family transcriptional regulator
VPVAISFEPYAQERLDAVESALAQGARLLAITAARWVGRANAVLPARDGATFGFRSRTSTLCLAQSLFLGLDCRNGVGLSAQGA